MRQTFLFTKTQKNNPKDETSLNAQLLLKGGFIFKEMAGAYDYLPLGLSVFNKISNIIREEMNAIGGQELFLTALQNPETWKATDRWGNDVIDVWFKLNLANGTEVGLANTHEEAMANVMTHHISSYRDLPAYPYQLQTKFRNELRSKSGIMRSREFIMKDLYSFNRSLEEQEEFYEQAKTAYMNIFNRTGIGDRTYLTFASGGAFSKFSHEFQTLSDAGEDTIYLSEEKNLAVNDEVYTDEVLADLGLDKGSLKQEKAIEVGNIFKLGTRYAEALGLTFTDEDGSEKPVVMGSYGVGPGRLMGTVVELNNDDKGIIWPESIAPFKVHLVALNLDDEEVRKKAESLYDQLNTSGVEVLYDDRDATAGEKFADSDLIGIPHRVVVSKKTGDEVEYKKRSDDDSDMMSVDAFLELVK